MKSLISFGLLCEGKCQFNHEYIINMVMYSLHPICIFFVLGFGCPLFRMNLKGDGLYMPAMNKCFSLVSNESELMSVLVIVKALGMVRVCYILTSML